MTRDEAIERIGGAIFAGAMMEMNRGDLGQVALEMVEELVAAEGATPPLVTPRPTPSHDPAAVAAEPLGWWRAPITAEAGP